MYPFFSFHFFCLPFLRHFLVLSVFLSLVIPCRTKFVSMNHGVIVFCLLSKMDVFRIICMSSCMSWHSVGGPGLDDYLTILID